MDINSVTTFITTVGFPIGACCAMGWYVNTTMKEFTETMQKNTLMLEKLITKIGDDKDV